MFRQNVDTIIGDLFKSEDIIPKNIYKHLKNSWAILFRKNIFQNIDEINFASLYSKDNKSRPNVPVNILLGLEIIKELFDYRDIELLSAFHLNFEVAYGTYAILLETYIIHII